MQFIVVDWLRCQEISVEQSLQFNIKGGGLCADCLGEECQIQTFGSQDCQHLACLSSDFTVHCTEDELNQNCSKAANSEIVPAISLPAAVSKRNNSIDTNVYFLAILVDEGLVVRLVCVPPDSTTLNIKGNLNLKARFYDLTVGKWLVRGSRQDVATRSGIDQLLVIRQSWQTQSNRIDSSRIQYVLSEVHGMIEHGNEEAPLLLKVFIIPHPNDQVEGYSIIQKYHSESSLELVNSGVAAIVQLHVRRAAVAGYFSVHQTVARNQRSHCAKGGLMWVLNHKEKYNLIEGLEIALTYEIAVEFFAFVVNYTHRKTSQTYTRCVLLKYKGCLVYNRSCVTCLTRTSYFYIFGLQDIGLSSRQLTIAAGACHGSDAVACVATKFTVSEPYIMNHPDPAVTEIQELNDNLVDGYEYLYPAVTEIQELNDNLVDGYEYLYSQRSAATWVVSVYYYGLQQTSKLFDRGRYVHEFLNKVYYLPSGGEYAEKVIPVGLVLFETQQGFVITIMVLITNQGSYILKVCLFSEANPGCEHFGNIQSSGSLVKLKVRFGVCLRVRTMLGVWKQCLSIGDCLWVYDCDDFKLGNKGSLEVCIRTKFDRSLGSRFEGSEAQREDSKPTQIDCGTEDSQCMFTEGSQGIYDQQLLTKVFDPGKANWFLCDTFNIYSLARRIYLTLLACVVDFGDKVLFKKGGLIRTNISGRGLGSRLGRLWKPPWLKGEIRGIMDPMEAQDMG